MILSSTDALLIIIAIGLAWLVRINIVTYRAFADDKARAISEQPRYPEVTLLNPASMGGSFGAMVAQRRLRHKTRKQPFAGQLRRIAVTQALLLVLAAVGLLFVAAPAEAAGNEFACDAPSHHDGDAIRCRGDYKSMRLFGIDAPEMPGACRPGRDCTPGDPYAARDYLASLTAGRDVTCEQVDTDRYDRAIVRCAADGADLSCAMVASGQAVERYGRLRCDAVASAPQRLAEAPGIEPPVRDMAPTGTAADGPEKRYYAPTEIEKPLDLRWLWFAVPLWLLFINGFGWFAMAIDKRRAIVQIDQPVDRMPETTLLLIAAVGGSPAIYAAQQKLRHKTRKQPFATQLLLLIGLQVGAMIGLLLWPFLPV